MPATTTHFPKQSAVRGVWLRAIAMSKCTDDGLAFDDLKYLSCAAARSSITYTTGVLRVPDCIRQLRQGF